MITVNSYRSIFSKSIAAFLTLSLLSGCGGGGSTNANLTPPPVFQPRELTSADLKSIDMLSTDAFPAPAVSNDADTITITHASNATDPNENYQFFLNTDNNASTGYQFPGEAWDDAGADYIVENGHLFKSVANDSSWNWDYNAGDVTYTKTATSVSVTIKQSLLKGLSPQIRVGFVIRDENWQVKSIWPGATLMALYTLNVSPPVDTTPPVISMNGSQTIYVEKNGNFVDPGATAIDNVDGDISTQIQTTSTLDISQIGTYRLTYTVFDNAGNQASVNRFVIVTALPEEGIVIDGSINDWVDIPVLAQSDNGTLKVTDTDDTLYLMMDSPRLGSNTQFFLDVDNNSDTGFKFTSYTWSEGGADYMIENNHLDKSRGTTTTWAWDYDVSNIDFIRNGNVIEVAIPKQALEHLSDNIKVGFANRDASWQLKSFLPTDGMADYALTRQHSKLTLLPQFCSNLWETNGEPAFTRISPWEQRVSNFDLIIEHNGDWFGVWERISAGSVETQIDIVKYDGVHTIQYLPLNLVLPEPLADKKITDMKFLGNRLYFALGNELWVTDGSAAGTHLVQRFAGNNETIVGLYPSLSFIAVHTRLTDSSNSSINQTYIMNQYGLEAKEQVFRIEASVEPLFTHVATNSVYLSDGVNYYKSDSTHNLELLDFKPLASYKDKLYAAKKELDNNFSIWIYSNTSTKQISGGFSGYGVLIAKPPIGDGDFYFTATDLPFTGRYLWRINENAGLAEKIIMDSSGGGFQVYHVHGNVYLKFSGKGNSRFLKLDEPTTDLLGTQIQLVFHNGELYYAHSKEGVRSIGTINDASGQLKYLATCN